jgi:hypothetical protein
VTYFNSNGARFAVLYNEELIENMEVVVVKERTKERK